MLKFKEYLKEDSAPEIAIKTDAELVRSHMAKANEDLNAVTRDAFVNSPLFVNAVRGTLERYGVLLPAESNIQQLSMEAERVYSLGDSGLYVYMVHNMNAEGAVEGYAQIVNREDMEDLRGSNPEDDHEDDRPNDREPSEWMKYPKARRDDDSGENAEYA